MFLHVSNTKCYLSTEHNERQYGTGLITVTSVMFEFTEITPTAYYKLKVKIYFLKSRYDHIVINLLNVTVDDSSVVYENLI